MHLDRPCQASPTSRIRPLALAAVLAIIPALAACGGAGKGPASGTPGAGSSPQGMAGSPGSAPITVIAEKVEPRTFTDRFTALGTAKANESIEVTSRTSSIVTRINFQEGQQVEAGHVLVELDTRQERANVSLAEAQLAQAESQYRRSMALRATQAVSEADLDQLEANLLVARAQLRGAQARLDILFIRAPFSGTVGLRKVSLGDLVGPDTIITTLDDTDPMKLEFGVPETFIGVVRKGMTISAASSVYPGRSFIGEVISVDSRVDPVTRSVTVVARASNRDGLLKPGMFLTVALERKRENVLLIPEEALVPREGRQFVFVAQDGKAVEREVVLGGRAPGLAEVTSGLEPGDLVVTEGTQRIRNGSPISYAQAG
jgi:membrane fusion protein (multidrug efflux system)